MQLQPSSTLPLQLSSSPLQSSVVAVAVALQDSTPAVQTETPPLQIPNLPVAQYFPASMGLSSANPLQSSSFPLHTSVPGRTSPTQAPQAPETQTWMPALQMPTPRVPPGPL